MRVLIAPGSFKGTLTASAAAEAMASGARRAKPDAEVILLPLADGGEGTTDALVAATGGRLVARSVTGPAGRPVTAVYGLLGADGRAAVVESAQAAGLGLIPRDQRDPRVTTTFGVGELLRAAAAEGVTEIVVGLGGTGTNDGGVGAMQALGARFWDSQERALPFGGAALARLARIDMSEFRFPRKRVSVLAATDVRNPLLGPEGASAVYGPQKGASPAAVAELEDALARYAEVVHRDLGVAVADLPGAGAAGGLGAALAAFLQASFRAGIDVVLEAAGFEAQAREADWVLTGEGCLDRQTLAGKTIAGLLRRCRSLGLPVIAFAGRIEAEAVAELRGQGLMQAVPLIQGSVTEAEALREPARVLEEAVAQTLGRIDYTTRKGVSP